MFAGLAEATAFAEFISVNKASVLFTETSVVVPSSLHWGFVWSYCMCRGCFGGESFSIGH